MLRIRIHLLHIVSCLVKQSNTQKQASKQQTNEAANRSISSVEEETRCVIWLLGHRPKTNNADAIRETACITQDYAKRMLFQRAISF